MLRRLLFTLLTLTICLLVAAVALGYALWLRSAGLASSTWTVLREVSVASSEAIAGLITQRGADERRVETHFTPRSPYGPEPLLGYGDREGVYTVTLTQPATGASHAFDLTVDHSGRRITSLHPERYAGRPEVWVFGDSYVYGWGNDDTATFPYLLQQGLPELRVLNFADNGYGNIHGLLQLRRALSMPDQRPPAIVVAAYADYLKVRNVAAPSRLQTFAAADPRRWDGDVELFRHPRGRLRAGRLEVDYVPLFDSRPGPDPTDAEQIAVTQQILTEMYVAADASGARSVLAFLEGADTDEVVTHARNLG